MALNPDEYRKTITFEDVSLGEPFEFSRTGHVRPLATETLQDLGKEYQQRFAARALYRDSVWQILVQDFFRTTLIRVPLFSIWEAVGESSYDIYMPTDGSRWILTPICRLASVRAWKPFYRTVRKLGRFRILHSMLFSRATSLNIFLTRTRFGGRYKRLCAA